MKKKIAIVVQRYGLEVNGGAELLARQLAEHLTDRYDVEVLTTKAVSYLTWKDEYKEDLTTIHGVLVRRFGVSHPCNRRIFNWYYRRVIGKKHTHKQEERWFNLQGPKSDDLIQYMEQHQSEYDAYVFMTYLYYPTVIGLPKVKEKAVLIPTAHDEETIYLETLRDLFLMPQGIFYLTKEEKAFVEKTFHNEHIWNNDGQGGCGIELPNQVDPCRLRKNLSQADRRQKDATQMSTQESTHESSDLKYMIYAGRIDDSKGCGELFSFFQRYRDQWKKNHKEALKLVLIGKPAMDIPKDEDIISLGFVSEQEKYDYMAGAQFLVMPSKYESLSIVVLEAMALGRPVLCNGVCEVLKGHCEHSEAGLYYKSYPEFADSCDRLLQDKDMQKQMSNNGMKYVNDHYTWKIVTNSFSELLDRVIKEQGKKN